MKIIEKVLTKHIQSFDLVNDKGKSIFYFRRGTYIFWANYTISTKNLSINRNYGKFGEIPLLVIDISFDGNEVNPALIVKFPAYTKKYGLTLGSIIVNIKLFSHIMEFYMDLPGYCGYEERKFDTGQWDIEFWKDRWWVKDD